MPKLSAWQWIILVVGAQPLLLLVLAVLLSLVVMIVSIALALSPVLIVVYFVVKRKNAARMREFIRQERERQALERLERRVDYSDPMPIGAQIQKIIDSLRAERNGTYSGR